MTSRRDDFLITGAREFLRAAAAIGAFGDHVFEAAASSVKKRSGELVSASGIDFKSAKIKQYRPNGYIPSGEDGTRAFIGASVVLPNFNFFDIYVWWRLSGRRTEQQECSLIASFRCKTTKMSNALFKAVHSISAGQAKIDGPEVYLENSVEPTHFPLLEKHFDDLVRAWITHLKAMGSLHKYLST
jgi:hypothetical protein